MGAWGAVVTLMLVHGMCRCWCCCYTTVRRHSCAACPSTLAPQSKHKERQADTREEDEKDGVPLTDLTGPGLCEQARKASSSSDSFLPLPSPASLAAAGRSIPSHGQGHALKLKDFSWLVASLALLYLVLLLGSELAVVLHLFFPAALSRLSVSNSFLFCSCLVILLAGWVFLLLEA